MTDSLLHAWLLIKWQWNLQTVQADQGNLSHHAVPADQQYHADQPNPGDLKDQEDPDRREDSCFIALRGNQCVSFIHVGSAFFFFSFENPQYKYTEMGVKF